jgi:D-specific alpha-keto acid dehydrogenase
MPSSSTDVAPSARPTRSHRVPGRAALGLTIYGCAPDEAALFEATAGRSGIVPTLTAAPISEATAVLAAGNRCVSVNHKTRVSAETLATLHGHGVRYVSTRSIGCNHVDLDAAARLGMTVEPVAYSPDSVADYTLLLILMALRHAASTVRRVDRRDFRLHGMDGRELRDLTVGVVGVGRIGAAVVARLRGFGCRVLAHDRHPKAPVEHVSLDTLLLESDVVTLHTPLDAGTHHLLDRRRLGLLRPGAVIINTGRGGLIDTAALVDALEHGRLGGAALDVVEGEEGIFYTDQRDRRIERPALRRLLELPNVIISPHSAFATDHALRDIVEQTLANCLAFAERTRPWIG